MIKNIALLTACSGFLVTSAGGESPSEPARSPAEETIFSSAQVPWEKLDNGWKRKVLFSGELTFVILEATGPGTGPIDLHHHPHDQISYLIDGEIEVQSTLGEGTHFTIKLPREEYTIGNA